MQWLWFLLKSCMAGFIKPWKPLLRECYIYALSYILCKSKSPCLTELLGIVYIYHGNFQPVTLHECSCPRPSQWGIFQSKQNYQNQQILQTHLIVVVNESKVNVGFLILYFKCLHFGTPECEIYKEIYNFACQSDGAPLLLCLHVFLSCPCWQIRLVKVLRQQLCAPALFCPVASVVPGNEPTLGIGKLKYTAKNKYTAVHRLTMHCCQQFCQHRWAGSTGRGWDHLSHFAKLCLGICVLWFQDLGAGTVFVLYLFSVTRWSTCLDEAEHCFPLGWI